MNRVTNQVNTNIHIFLDELWKHSDKGEEVVDIDIGELSKDYKYIVKTYLLHLQKIGCINYDYFGDHYLVAVKSKEAVQ